MSAPILVTAFGPFGGRTLNASSLALAELRRTDRFIRTRVLPVDLVEAPRRLRAAIRRLSPRAILLLGEAAGAQCLRIESKAWNDLDFSIPDISGRQPRGRPIVLGGPAFLPTPIDCRGVLRALQRAGHAAEASEDPGRYLCNRLYHAALHAAATPSLFVHLPLESRLAPTRAADALRLVLQWLGDPC
jgi:pyroglutamyl-peptidase